MTINVRNILKAVFLSALLVVSPTMSADDSQRIQSEVIDYSQISISVSESNLRVKNADGCTIEIFSLTGEKVFTQRIEGQSKSIDLSQMQHRVYIVKIGKFTRKIYLR